jgi:hypothetical protein
MARSDAPFGFMPYGTVLRKQMYRVAAAATVMFKYDLVIRAAAGDVDAATIANRRLVLGTVLACFDNNKLPKEYIADSGSGYVLVADDPNQLYIAQEDLTGATLGLADRGLNAAFISTHRGNTTTGRSKMEIDSSSAAASRALQLNIIDCHRDDALESATSHYRRWICKINWAALGGQASGV